MRYLADFEKAERAAKKTLKIAKIKKEYYWLLEKLGVFPSKALSAASYLDFDFVLNSNEFDNEEKEKVLLLKKKYDELNKIFE